MFNKLIHAETVEKAVIDAVKETLLDGDNLKLKLTSMIEAMLQQTVAIDVEALKQKREKLKQRTAFLVANLDEETLADAQRELDKLKSERRRLDEQIATATASTQTPQLDADQLAQQMLEKTQNFLNELPTLPNHLLREWLAAVVSKVVVDMETKAIEIHVQLPTDMLKSALSSEKAMRFVTTSASSSDYQTHPLIPIPVGRLDCVEQRIGERGFIERPCYICRRAA